MSYINFALRLSKQESAPGNICKVALFDNTLRPTTYFVLCCLVCQQQLWVQVPFQYQAFQRARQGGKWSKRKDGQWYCHQCRPHPKETEALPFDLDSLIDKP